MEQEAVMEPPMPAPRTIQWMRLRSIFAAVFAPFFAPFFALVLAALLLANATHAETVQSLPQPQDYVSDFAHVLSNAAVERLDQICSSLDHGTANAQIAIVIVRNLNGDDAADFASRLEERWKVGRKGSDRGILMLLSTEDHKYWIEVGYGLEGILPDGKTGDIGRAMVPDLKNGNYDAAVLTGVSQIANILSPGSANPDSDNPDSENPAQAYAARHRHPISPLGLLIRIVLVILVLGFLGSRGILGLFLGMMMGGGFGGWGGGGFGGGGGGGDSGFGGFGGGESGGGGAGGSW